jgi:microsomal dipeptidase-like Zn-dependent dipeptidase
VAGRLTRATTIAAGVLGTSAAFVAGAVALGGAASQLVERRRNRVHRRGVYVASGRAVDLHRTLTVVDLHADSLLWGRDLRRRASYGHLDVPRLVEGGVALVALAASTQVPRRVNLERNDDRTDNVTLLALGQRWPRATWDSRLARALHLAFRLRVMAADSAGRLSVIESRDDLDAYLARRSADRAITAAFLAIEGAQALDGDLDNLELLFRAGYRMLSPAHFFDTAYGGSAHGVVKGGLTEAGRELLSRAESIGMVVDVAHASSASIDDVLALAARPVVASHTGVRAAAPGVRNLPDDQVRAIAATGGIVGIGFWPVACGGTEVADIARSIVTAIELAGVDHVGLGSDFDGAVPTPFDASGMPLLTDALLAEGLSETDIAGVMGGNAVRLLAAALPAVR